MSFINNLDWRFATKKFDTNENVSDKNIKHICDAARMAPSSYGLQPWHIYIVSDPEIKKKMQVVSYMQPQVADAPYVLVFCSRQDVIGRIDSFADLQVKNNIADSVKAAEMQKFLKGVMGKKNDDQILSWAQRQTYIALGFALAACCELHIDSCPMEGFINEKMDALLRIPPYMKSVALLAVGYRIEPPSRAKFRFPEVDLFTRV